jgi:hypothetical protein
MGYTGPVPCVGDDAGAWPGAHHREPAEGRTTHGPHHPRREWCVAWSRFTLDLASPLTGTGPSVRTWDHTQFRSTAVCYGRFPDPPSSDGITRFCRRI